ncbi:MAG: hypothetical protein HZA04_08030 [Nitrospinae bacterium]|nr:hypothetical protein [Nitrospinota bacterium]
MAGEFTDSPFGPPKDLAQMDLLYPTGDVYKKNEALAVGCNAAVIVVASVLLTIMGFQYRYSTRGNLINPQATILIFSVCFVAFRYWSLNALTPVRLFFDKEGGKVVFFKKRFFGTSRENVEAAKITGVEMHDAGNEKWELILNGSGGEKFRVPPVGNRVLVRHGAERAARFLKQDIAISDASGAETAKRKAGVVEDPYYKRLQAVKAPLPRNDIFILKTKLKGGVKYDISLPLWIASSVFGFALMNLGIGIYIWMVLAKDTARWASVPFLINTFIVFVIAAMVHNLKRTIEVTGEGLKMRGQTIPLWQLAEINTRPGFVNRLIIESDTDTFTVLLTKKQIEWLKQDLEFEIWNRRPQEKRKE